MPIIAAHGTFEGYVGIRLWDGQLVGRLWSFSLFVRLIYVFCVGVPYQLSFIPEDDA